jgi:peptidoglycan/xylan/chitin deacetylase (PgdA/CDA1 family)
MRKFFQFSLFLGGILLPILWGLGLVGPLPVTGAEPVWGGSRQKLAVALTFDDGPSLKYTPKILATLRQYHARGTFFVMGKHVEAYPWIVRTLFQEGQELGNHGFSHCRLTQADGLTRERELERTGLDLDMLGCPQPRLFRPPYSAYDGKLLSYLDHTNRRLVLWGLDSGDWKGLPADLIVINVLTRVRPGAIIVFHDGDEKGQADRTPTVTALHKIIPALQAAGYRLVTVSELLALSSHVSDAGRKIPAASHAYPSSRDGTIRSHALVAD